VTVFSHASGSPSGGVLGCAASFLRVTHVPNSSASRGGSSVEFAAPVPACTLRLSVALRQSHHFSELPRDGRQQHGAQEAVLLLLD
jgi:hypothetical protein